MIPPLVIGEGGNVADPGAATPVVCYTIGSCVFSELSHLAVQWWEYTQQPDCSWTTAKTTAEWAFSARTASSMTWSGTGGSATYSASTNRWTYTLTSATPFSAEALCLGLSGPAYSVHSCMAATFYQFWSAEEFMLFSLAVHRNDCIPNAIA